MLAHYVTVRALNFIRIVQRRWWLVVIALFSAAVALKLNGSSVGAWQQILREPGKPPGLLLFTPKHIRADEWYVITPSMLSQARQMPPFPTANENLGGGLSPLLMSVPVAYYTTFFRPQLWGFFVLDFERAFSFYWCCKVFGLALAFAWLLRCMGIRRTRIVVFGAAWLFFSSFTQWWFSSPAMLPEMLTCWSLCTGCVIVMFASASSFRGVLAAIGFAFFGINFILCFYPGFQIPLLYVSVALLLGLWWEQRVTGAWNVARGSTLLACSAIAAALVLLPFWFTARDTIALVSHTSYPGVFRSHGGGLSVPQLFSGVLGFFEAERRVLLGFDNICEASNFYPLAVLILIACVLNAWRRRLRVDPIIVALAVPILFLSAYCVLPFPTLVAKLTGFGLTTEGRLLLGIGIADILLCCVFFDRHFYNLPPAKWAPVIAVALSAALGGYMLAGSTHTTWGALIVGINCVVVAWFFTNRARTAFLTAFTALVAINGIRINPVMTGLGPLLQSQAYQSIDKIRRTNPGARWIVYDDVYPAQLVKATGAPVLNGVKILPDFELMKSLDPAGRYAHIYNRYAYINVALPQRPDEMSFQLIDFNYYQVNVSPASQALAAARYDFALFPEPWPDSQQHGFAPLEVVDPAAWFVYRRSGD